MSEEAPYFRSLKISVKRIMHGESAGKFYVRRKNGNWGEEAVYSAGSGTDYFDTAEEAASHAARLVGKYLKRTGEFAEDPAKLAKAAGEAKEAARAAVVASDEDEYEEEDEESE